MSDNDEPKGTSGEEPPTPHYERHDGPPPEPAEDENTGMHPAIKVLLIILIGIPVLFVVLVLLVLGACFISG